MNASSGSTLSLWPHPNRPEGAGLRVGLHTEIGRRCNLNLALVSRLAQGPNSWVTTSKLSP
jgi:hypothetical protein